MEKIMLELRNETTGLCGALNKHCVLEFKAKIDISEIVIEPD